MDKLKKSLDLCTQDLLTPMAANGKGQEVRDYGAGTRETDSEELPGVR